MMHPKPSHGYITGGFIVILSLLCIITSCKKEDIPDTFKEIITITLKDANARSVAVSEMVIDTPAHRIDIIVPATTDLTYLVPEFSFRGLSITPASGEPQDFSQSVVYTVKAEDGSAIAYTITIRKALRNKMVYIGSSDNNFYAIDGNSGKLKWKYTSTHAFAYSSPTYADGRVYVGGIDSYVYCFDAITGAVIWKYQASTTGIESDAVIDNGTVYVGTNDDYLFAINASNGQLKWKFLTGGNVSASPVISNGVVYFGSSDSKVYAVDVNTGQLRWVFTTGDMINQSGPALVAGVLYVGSRDGYLYAINADTGTEKWKYDANKISLEQSSPTVSNGIVYIGGWYGVPDFYRKGSLLAVDANTGTLIWEKLANTAISSSPSVYDGRVYVTADDMSLHVVDAITGGTYWTRQILSNGASPGVANGVVYVGGGGTGYIYAFDAIYGFELWRFPIGHGGLMISAPLIVSESGEPFYSGDSGFKQ